MADFVVNIGWILHRLGDFIAQEPAESLPEIVELFFYHRLGDL